MPFVEQGRDLFRQREGQLNLACANCHEDNFDKHLAGSPITQAQPTAYEYGAPELVAFELYLMSRARGMPMETPAVRP